MKTMIQNQEVVASQKTEIKFSAKVISLFAILFLSVLSSACSNLKLEKDNSGSSLSSGNTTDRNGSGNGLYSDSLDSLVPLEMTPYLAFTYNPDGTIGSSTPKHNEFIAFLEQRGLTLSNTEKDLIRNDSSDVRILFKYLTHGELQAGSSNNGDLRPDLAFELEVRFQARSIKLKSESFLAIDDLTFYISRFDATRTRFMMSPKANYAPSSYLGIISTSLFMTSNGSNEGLSVLLVDSSGGAAHQLLSNKNSKQQSGCAYTRGGFLNSFCGVGANP